MVGCEGGWAGEDVIFVVIFALIGAGDLDGNIVTFLKACKCCAGMGIKVKVDHVFCSHSSISSPSAPPLP